MIQTAGPRPPAPRRRGDRTIHFRPHRRRYTPPSTLMTLSRFAPMIDLSFLLLVFFMTTTRFERPEGLLASALPAVSGEPAPGLPFSPIVIRVNRTGEGHDDYGLKVDGFAEAPSRVGGLAGFLRGMRELPGFDRQTPVLIVAENDIAWDHVVGCWNAILQAGYEQVAFAEP